MKPTTIALFLLCTTIGSVQTISAADTTQTPIDWQYDPHNPQAFYDKLPKIRDLAKQKNTEAIEQLRTKIREWRKTDADADHYFKVYHSLAAIYKTTLTEKTAHIVSLMPLFSDLNFSLLDTLRLAIYWNDRTGVTNVRYALEQVTTIPKLVIAELINNKTNDIKPLWPYIPPVAQERMLTAAEDRSRYTFNNDGKTWTENRVEHETIATLLPTMRHAHQEYTLLRTIIMEETQKS